MKKCIYGAGMNPHQHLVFVNHQEQESALASEQRCAQLEKARRELQQQLSGLSDQLEEEEACSAQLALHRDRLEAECGSLRRDLDNLQSALSAAAQAKQVEQNGIFIKGNSSSCVSINERHASVYLDPWTIGVLQLSSVHMNEIHLSKLSK